MLGKHIKFVTFLVYSIVEIPAIFSNLEPSAWPEVTHEMSFSYERMAAMTRYEEEAKVINGLLSTIDILGRNIVSFDAHYFL